MKLNPGMSWQKAKSSTQQEEGSFLQQIRLQFNEETNKPIHLEHSFLWC